MAGTRWGCVERSYACLRNCRCGKVGSRQFEKCRRILTMSDYRGRPEASGRAAGCQNVAFDRRELWLSVQIRAVRSCSTRYNESASLGEMTMTRLSFACETELKHIGRTRVSAHSFVSGRECLVLRIVDAQSDHRAAEGHASPEFETINLTELTAYRS